MSIDPNRAHDLVRAARELAPDRRAGFLARNCGADLVHLNRTFNQLERLYEAWGKPEQATDWRTRKNSRP